MMGSDDNFAKCSYILPHETVRFSRDPALQLCWLLSHHRAGETAGSIVTAPFDAAAGRRASSADEPKDKKRSREEERPAPTDHLEESRPAQPVER